MKFRYLLAACAAALLSVEAHASGRNGTYQDHVGLHDAIQSKGIPVVKNHRSCLGNMGGGMYGYIREVGRLAMYVCQDNGVAGGPQVDWTANDLDTLRHEAWHMLQDCLDQNLSLSLTPVYSDAESLKAMVEGYGINYDSLVSYVMKNYGDRGVDTVWLEIEAHAIAIGGDASKLAGLVTEYCPYKTTL